jgi:hypothetical protein
MNCSTNFCRTAPRQRPGEFADVCADLEAPISLQPDRVQLAGSAEGQRLRPFVGEDETLGAVGDAALAVARVAERSSLRRLPQRVQFPTTNGTRAHLVPRTFATPRRDIRALARPIYPPVSGVRPIVGPWCVLTGLAANVHGWPVSHSIRRRPAVAGLPRGAHR